MMSVYQAPEVMEQCCAKLGSDALRVELHSIVRSIPVRDSHEHCTVGGPIAGDAARQLVPAALDG